MNMILNLLIVPSETFLAIKNKPRWFASTLMCTGSLFLLLWFGGCWRNLAEGLSMSSIFGPALISPLIVTIVSLGTSLILFLLTRVIPGESGVLPDFKTVFSLNLHCAIIIVLGEVVNFLLVHANILGDTSFPLPNRFPLGLDLVLLFFNEPGIYAAIILHSTSVFVVWYLVLLAKGIREITRSSTTRSAIIAAGLWCAVVLCALGIVSAAGGGTTIRISM
jgi:hypothetical protein